MTPQLSNYTIVGTGTVSYLQQRSPVPELDRRQSGSPAARITEWCLYQRSGQGFSFTAPADTAARTLMVHVGGYNSGGTLTAHFRTDRRPISSIHDGSSGQYDRNYTLDLSCRLRPDRLDGNLEDDTPVAGNVTLNAAALTGGSGTSIVATAGTPQSAAVSTAFATALQATVKDSGGNPVSGATVTFTAPASGASGTFGGSATATVITNASGVATAPALTANSQTGGYTVIASCTGVATRPASV